MSAGETKQPLTKDQEVDLLRKFIQSLPDSYLRDYLKGTPEQFENMIRSDYVEPLADATLSARRELETVRKEIKDGQHRRSELASKAEDAVSLARDSRARLEDIGVAVARIKRQIASIEDNISVAGPAEEIINPIVWATAASVGSVCDQRVKIVGKNEDDTLQVIMQGTGAEKAITMQDIAGIECQKGLSYFFKSTGTEPHRIGRQPRQIKR